MKTEQEIIDVIELLEEQIKTEKDRIMIIIFKSQIDYLKWVLEESNKK